MKRSLLLILLPAAVLALAIWAYNRPGDEQEVVDETPRQATPPRIDPKQAVIPVPPVDPASDASKFLLPDGSYALALNGVIGAKPLNWPSNEPWSPIKGKVRGDNGDEWYVHENGSMSTTVWATDHVRGMRMPITRLARPGKSGPAAIPSKK